MAARWRNSQTNHLKQSTAKKEEFNLLEKMKSGPLPPNLMGLGYNSGGNSMFSSVAHRAIQEKRMSNLLNDTTAGQIFWNVRDEHGPVDRPFEVNGKVYYPDSTGTVRITDMGKVSLAKQIKEYRREKVDKLMDLAMLGDDICQYIFGVNSGEWTEMCKKKGRPDGLDASHISDELAEQNCTVQYIESLPPSLTQTQAVAKLRKIVEHFADNVNLEGISGLEDIKENIKDGKNVVYAPAEIEITP